MKQPDLWLSVAFVGMLAAIGIVVNTGINFLRTPTAQTTSTIPSSPPAPSKSPGPPFASVANDTKTHDPSVDEANDRHRKFLDRYLNSTTPKLPGTTCVAIVSSTENRTPDEGIADVIAAKLGSVRTLPNLFRPEFIADPIFLDAYQGSRTIFNELELGNFADAVILSREIVEYSKNPSLENVITANVRLEMKRFWISTGRSKSWSFVVNGAGFHESEARAMAEERLVAKFKTDTNALLEPVPTNQN